MEIFSRLYLQLYPVIYIWLTNYTHSMRKSVKNTKYSMLLNLIWYNNRKNYSPGRQIKTSELL
jgi:hypothetical protein